MRPTVRYKDVGENRGTGGAINNARNNDGDGQHTHTLTGWQRSATRLILEGAVLGEIVKVQTGRAAILVRKAVHALRIGLRKKLV